MERHQAAGDTIIALSSAPGKAGVAVLRLSGPGSDDILGQMVGTLPPVRQASLRAVSDDGNLIDRALILRFNAPHSFTGEDSAEIHCHGSIAVIDRIISVCRGRGARIAEPGEFTRRAFTNGKLDLTAAEGLEDLIDAETEAQRAQALAVADGAIRATYERWKDALLELRAAAEAEIDFPEDDLPDDLARAIAQKRLGLMQDLSRHLTRSHSAERLRTGVRVVLLGAPNAGKSSLLNALAQRDVAIVSDIAGTTRDRIEVSLDLGGYPVILTDTAGLRDDSTDSIEQQGMARARQAEAEADIRVWLVDGSGANQTVDPCDLLVATKRDLASFAAPENAFAVSVETGLGLPEFLGELERRVGEVLNLGSSDVVSGRQRHREALVRMVALLERAESAPLPELAAEDYRSALDEIGRLLGTVDVEELLDHLFSGFCIGK